jgi:hypothetical protein
MAEAEAELRLLGREVGDGGGGDGGGGDGGDGGGNGGGGAGGGDGTTALMNSEMPAFSSDALSSFMSDAWHVNLSSSLTVFSCQSVNSAFVKLANVINLASLLILDFRPSVNNFSFVISR